MKNSLFILLTLHFLVGFSQKTYQKNYYKNGNLKEEGWIKDGFKQAYWIFYHSNGSIKEKGHYKNGLRNKYWYFYRQDATKEKEGHYANGAKNLSLIHI